MKNNQGILNLTEKKVSFKFNDEDFVMDLTEGDLHDSWNSFVDKNNVTRDLNFHWEGFSENHKPSLTVYELTDNGDGTWSTNWSEDTNIKLIQVIGTEGEYFDLPFDGTTKLTFEVTDKDGNLIMKSNSFNKACDESIINNAIFTAIDVYGNRKQLNQLKEAK